jgi:BirA family biotin operon repressor/biotin-[acetyl-CoA-carboxylase] ligase
MKQPWPILSLNSVSSTNNYASKLLAENKIVEETVIIAHKQEHGRGQQDNIWQSEPGMNLTFSLVLFTNFIEVKNQFFLSQAISLAILDLLRLNNITAKIKWPNDIYVNENKIGGILIENSIMDQTLMHSVIGIGLNVNQEFFEENISNAVSMKTLLFKDFILQEVLDGLLHCIKNWIDYLKTDNYNDLKKEYLGNLYIFGAMKKFSSNAGDFYGTIIDVEETGELVILADDGRKLKFMFKEIQFL